MASLLIWGFIFLKKDPERKDLVVLSFCAGVLSVVPIFFVLGALGSSPIHFGEINIAGLDLYRHIQDLAAHGGVEQLGIYILVSIIAFFLIYLVVAAIMFLLDMISGEQTLASYEKILSRSLEAPFIFISLGIVMGIMASVLDWSLNEILWKSMMVGAVEEYAKHLVLRFSDENKFRSIGDAIEFSILVALGFAFLENILYFVDRIWLTPCTNSEIAQGICLFEKTTGAYQHQIGALLWPVIFRSIFSTLAHVVSSGMFGYFYGLAYFASDNIRAYAKRPKALKTKVMIFFHRILQFKGYTLLHEEKLLEGAILAMVFHGTFDFVLDGEVNSMTMQNFGVGSLIIIVPLIMMGAGYLFYLINKPGNKIAWANEHVLERRTKMHSVEQELEKKYGTTFEG